MNKPYSDELTPKQYIDVIKERDTDIRKLTETATLRDQFAMAALTGLIVQIDKEISASELARQAYVCADAMMIERKR